MWRHVTSRDGIFIKLTENVSYVYILRVSQYEVIRICFEQVMIVYLFSFWYTVLLGNTHHLPLTDPP